MGRENLHKGWENLHKARENLHKAGENLHKLAKSLQKDAVCKKPDFSRMSCTKCCFLLSRRHHRSSQNMSNLQKSKANDRFSRKLRLLIQNLVRLHQCGHEAHNILIWTHATKCLETSQKLQMLAKDVPNTQQKPCLEKQFSRKSTNWTHPPCDAPLSQFYPAKQSCDMLTTWTKSWRLSGIKLFNLHTQKYTRNLAA